jgi:2-dehydro-3-deoxyglucarate aldolase/4-hydroxy-2-oxoheptanedioate aldolase
VIVRVAWNDQVLIKQVLDCGAGGVVVPLIRSGKDARDAVAACMYPPAGIRGYGPRRPGRFGRQGPEYIATANDNIVVFAQIEHVDAVTNIEEIVSVPGLTGVLIGRNDLSGSMGLLGQAQHPQVSSAIDRVLAVVRRSGMHVGIVSSEDPQQALSWAKKGMTFITLDCDDGFLVRASQAAVGGAREILMLNGVPL